MGLNKENFYSVGVPLLLVAVFFFLPVLPVKAKMSGICSNCHTMHNSQNGASMAIGSSTGTKEFLLRGTCIGCHAQGTGQKIVNMDGSQVPQVFHTDASGDLAAGNYAYILGGKGGTPADSHGHNVVDLGKQESVLYGPPGGIVLFGHDDGFNVNNTNLTCAGTNGCHGVRYSTQGPTSQQALRGAHHNNVDGQCDLATTVANSYRFLRGVKGYENQTDKWQNTSATSHNEYYGTTSPVQLSCSTRHCHEQPDSVTPPTNTISGFCGTCHGNFHTLKTSTSSGIGTVNSSPFVRHPNDIVIKNSGEYQYYTSYDVTAPVGRTTVPSGPSGTVTPGSDVVTCLSCHMAHASPYPDMLRWDYTQMVAGTTGAGAGKGCFVCHTLKDG